MSWYMDFKSLDNNFEVAEENDKNINNKDGINLWAEERLIFL